MSYSIGCFSKSSFELKAEKKFCTVVRLHRLPHGCDFATNENKHYLFNNPERYGIPGKNFKGAARSERHP